MMTNRIKTTLFLFLLCAYGWAQQANVVSFTETIDIIAGDDQRRDLNRQLCALVKVQVVDDIIDVEGNVVGDIVNRGVEKWVYMAKGSRNMKIHLKNNLPVLVKFRDYNMASLKSNRVYVLVINAPRSASVEQSATVESNYLSMQVTPANANVTIWGNDQQKKVYRPQADGTLSLSLPYGRYYYKVQANGYSDAEGSVFVNDENQIETVTLSAVEGTLTISCPTKKSEFFINGKRVEKANNATSWTGRMKPGKYQVEIKCNGYVSRTLTAEVRPNQTSPLQIEALLSERDAQKEIDKKNKELAKQQKEDEKKQKELTRQQEKKNKELAKQQKEEEKKNKELARQQEKKNKAELAAKKKENTSNSTIVTTSPPKAKIKSNAASSTDKLTFGVVAGGNMASASFEGKSGGETSSVIGFHLGVTMDVPISSSFWLSTGVLYSGKGYQYKRDSYNEDINIKANPQYIDVPLLASYHLSLSDLLTLRLNAGPYVAICIGGDIKNDVGDWNVSYYSKTFTSEYSSFDYGIQAGVGLDFGKNFGVNIGYQIGIASDYKNRNLMLSLAYRF